MIDPKDEMGAGNQTSRPAETTVHPPEAPLAPKAGFGEKLFPFVVMGLVLVLDQYTKNLVETRIPLYGYWAPFPALEDFLRITHTANTGAVFGLFQGSGIFFTVLALVIVSAIIYFNLTLPGNQWLLRLALGLQLGGAIGNNVIDRLRLGHVTDFIDIGPWYIFNVADMAIVGGVILFAFVLIKEELQHKKNSPSTLHPVDTPDS